MTKKCELCASEAKTYCESDRAWLCWDCDARVHGANFLVAKHARTVLCRACHSLTSWSASGPKLCPTVTLCRSCLRGDKTTHSGEAEEGDEEEEERDDLHEHCEDDDVTEEESDDEDCMEDEEENQVVPWSNPGQPVSSVSDSAFSWRSCFS